MDMLTGFFKGNFLGSLLRAFGCAASAAGPVPPVSLVCSPATLVGVLYPASLPMNDYDSRRVLAHHFRSCRDQIAAVKTRMDLSPGWPLEYPAECLRITDELLCTVNAAGHGPIAFDIETLKNYAAQGLNMYGLLNGMKRPYFPSAADADDTVACAPVFTGNVIPLFDIPPLEPDILAAHNHFCSWIMSPLPDVTPQRGAPGLQRK